MEKIKTKEYAINDDLVINKLTVNYCTESDMFLLPFVQS